MTVCSNCGKESLRTRIIWAEDGTKREECPNCAPENFGKVTDPSDKKIWMGYEAHPNEYVKAEDGGYDRKPEYRSEQEAKLSGPTEEERLAQERAVERKRKERRTKPLNGVELAAAIRRAEEVAHFIQISASEGRDIN
jgi:hypothetical protein